MSKRTQSQWDFGELFPTGATRRVLSVSELTSQVKRLLEKEGGLGGVTGEVTNLRVQSSGHIYFTLKDPASQLSCVLFRGETGADRESLEDGRKVVVQGDLTVYEPRGQYQLVVRQVELQGVGALQLAFEKLKRKLQAEGLFEAGRKRRLPGYPQRIGLVTSPTGAAIRDVLHVVQRRNPGLEIVLAPCRVQGDGAAEEIAAAIRLLNEFAQSLNRRIVESKDGSTVRQLSGSTQLDLILVTRGGGSLEDLWAFNEEVVARAIFESAVPVVSAVGHEIDFTISDFVADLRAATPSAAAEIITEGVSGSRDFMADAGRLMAQRTRRRVEHERDSLEQLTQRMTRPHPRRRLGENSQRLDDLQIGLMRGLKQRWRQCQSSALILRQRLARFSPVQRVVRDQRIVRELNRRLNEHVMTAAKTLRSRVAAMEDRLRLLSPMNVLNRGYSITTDAVTGRVIRAAGEAREGQRLKTRLGKGEIRSVVEDERLDSTANRRNVWTRRGKGRK